MKNKWAWLLLTVILTAGLGINVRAADKKIEECLVYTPDEMSWDDEQVYVAGYVSNDSDVYDIYALEDVELVVYDSEGTFIFSVFLDNEETGQIVLAPGEVCPFNVTVAGRLNDRDYELEDGFYADISAVFSYDKCGGRNCRICGGTQQETQQPANSGAGFGTDILPDYSWMNDYTDYDFGSTPSYETECSRCGGTGRTKCTVCNGTGYMTRTKYGIDLGSGGTKYETRTKCGCDNGYYSCILCGGDGKY